MMGSPRVRSWIFPVRCTPWRSAATGGGWPSARACRPARGWCRFTPCPTARWSTTSPGMTMSSFALALRPDGGQLASASFDQTVRLWNLGLDRPDGVFRGHSDFVYSRRLHPDGRALLTSGKDRTDQADQCPDTQGRAHLQRPRRRRADRGGSPGREAVRVGGQRAADPLVELRGRQAAARRGGHSGPVQQLVFSGDGQRLISAGGDRSVRLWDGKTGEPIRQLAGRGEWQYAAAISDDGRLAAAGGWDGLARLWDTDTGRLRATLVQPPSAAGQPKPGRAPGPDWIAIGPAGMSRALAS